MLSRLYALSLIAAVACLAGCAREWKDPNQSIPAKELGIPTILINKVMFDGAGVIVVGKAWDVTRSTDFTVSGTVEYTVFKIADKKGNYIGVYSTGHLEVLDGDKLRVTGYYRRELTKDERIFQNEIEAVRVEMLN